MSKAREFWVKGSYAHEFEVVNSIHVIEISAYEEKCRELAEMQSGCCDCSVYKSSRKKREALESKLAVAVEALENEIIILEGAELKGSAFALKQALAKIKGDSDG